MGFVEPDDYVDTKDDSVLSDIKFTEVCTGMMHIGRTSFSCDIQDSEHIAEGIAHKNESLGAWWV